jgi:ribosomal protein S18 acetylase RimI-like enzyme
VARDAAGGVGGAETYSMSDGSVRQATLKDLDAMLEVWRLSDEDAGDGRRREVAKALELASDLVVAEADNQIVGVIVGTTDGLFGYPTRLIVRPTHRRQGVGRALIRELSAGSWRGEFTGSKRDDPA